ncbi:hypothetical protein RCO27_14015 [Sphingosinicella sp. LHD-64]|uniref:hypothetical protein n=1 Tax=Sphingosinicella sp. LHD-64 TaxID=3072139 RepID=UPI00280CA798|nr:hypothetical protein [Sphingosinicella sp. LHD-64]MDQ8757342.1 hypothetical protein [Sphingosinicella sp. LHD-64]
MTPITRDGWEGLIVLREEVRGLPDVETGRDGATAADLVRGLTFLRASNMQVMRLHLAQEQDDRRGMMAALDELVGLDRELARFVETMPDPALADVGEAIDAQRQDLLEQRMVLARGKLGPALTPVPAYEPEPEAIAADAPMLREDVYEEEAPRRRWPWVMLGLLILAAAAVAAWLYLDAAALPTLISWWERLA